MFKMSITQKIAVAYLGRPHLVRGQLDKCRNVRLPFLSSQNSMNTGFHDTNPTRTLPQWLLWGSCKNCMTASALSLSVELLFLPHRHFNTYCTNPSTSNLSRILVIITLVCDSVPNSTLQRRWTSTTFSTFQYHFSNHLRLSNDNFTASLFKYEKSDESVAILFPCLLDHTRQKRISVSFRCCEITFERVFTSIWYILNISTILFSLINVFFPNPCHLEFLLFCSHARALWNFEF